MPLYEYECFLCGHRFERIQRVSAPPAPECPSCGGAVRRLLGVPALVFKGSGFHITDYPKQGSEKSTGDAAEPAAPGSDASKDASPKKESDSKASSSTTDES